MTSAPNRRSAFTLVEMLVASALIIFMMYIITAAFDSGLTSFRVLKAQGDMQEKLRAVATTLRTDLTAPHFAGRMQPSHQGPFLSHQRLNDQTWTPPEQGYFRIAMPNLAGIPEGTDPDNPGLQYFRLNPSAATTNPNQNPPSHFNTYLQFTVNLTDGHSAIRDGRSRRDQFFSTDGAGAGGMHVWNKPDYNINDVPFSSNWAEVTYFLLPNSQTTSGDGPLTLYTLFRRQKLLVEPNATAASWLPNSPNTSDPLYQRLNPANPPYPPDPVYPPRTFPRFLTTAGETDRDFPDVSTWYRYTNWPLASPQPPPFPEYVFNSPADVTQPVRRWGTMSKTSPPYALANAPLAYGQPVATPFLPILDEAINQYLDPKLGQRIGGDILLTDVVNFEIRVLWEPVRVGALNTERFDPPKMVNGSLVIPPDYMPPSDAGNPDYPFDVLPLGYNPAFNPPPQPPTTRPFVRVFDTWSAINDTSGAQPYLYGVDPTLIDSRDYVGIKEKASSFADPNYANWNAGHMLPPLQSQPRQQPSPMPSQLWQPGQPTQAFTNIPLRVRVRALQIKLRLWDRKTSQTRQVTIIQDL